MDQGRRDFLRAAGTVLATTGVSFIGARGYFSDYPMEEPAKNMAVGTTTAAGAVLLTAVACAAAMEMSPPESAPAPITAAPNLAIDQ